VRNAVLKGLLVILQMIMWAVIQVGALTMKELGVKNNEN